MTDIFEDINVLENLVIAMQEGASDEKRAAIQSVQRLIEKKKEIITSFEEEHGQEKTW